MIPSHVSGFFANKDAKKIIEMEYQGKYVYIVANNNDLIQIFAMTDFKRGQMDDSYKSE